MLLCVAVACSEKSIAKFAKGLLDGSVQPEYKSAPIPDEPTDGGVTVIVGKNFDEIVKNKDKDVLLEVGGTCQRAGARWDMCQEGACSCSTYDLHDASPQQQRCVPWRTVVHLSLQLTTCTSCARAVL